jgi:hypothetical protein
MTHLVAVFHRQIHTHRIAEEIISQTIRMDNFKVWSAAISVKFMEIAPSVHPATRLSYRMLLYRAIQTRLRPRLSPRSR